MPSTRTLYGITAFLSALLLFVVEPLAAKQMLPTLGGSSAVWLTCLVFFQVTLLLGYGYAHWLTGSMHSAGKQRSIQRWLAVAAAVALALSLAFIPDTTNSANPVTTIFWTLGRSIGLPFLILSSTSPLLQRWLSQIEATPDGEPAPVWYRLFALSNAGSLIALLAYPTLIEPYIPLRLQKVLWGGAFLAYFALVLVITGKPSST
ncbi:MAG TPA: hypothetical protein VIM60_00165, partial [Edaphobacter sp.]